VITTPPQGKVGIGARRAVPDLRAERPMLVAKRSVVLNDYADTRAKFIQDAQRDMFPFRYEPQAG